MPVLGVLHQALLAWIAERVSVRISFPVQIDQISRERVDATPLSGQRIIIMLQWEQHRTTASSFPGVHRWKETQIMHLHSNSFKMWRLDLLPQQNCDSKNPRLTLALKQ